METADHPLLEDLRSELNRQLDDYLVVQGEKQVEQEHKRGRYRITECAYGRFERAIPLPENVDADRATEKYRHGVLRVELPKTNAGARSIKVNVN